MESWWCVQPNTMADPARDDALLDLFLARLSGGPGICSTVRSTEYCYYVVRTLSSTKSGKGRAPRTSQLLSPVLRMSRLCQAQARTTRATFKWRDESVFFFVLLFLFCARVHAYIPRRPRKEAQAERERKKTTDSLQRLRDVRAL